MLKVSVMTLITAINVDNHEHVCVCKFRVLEARGNSKCVLASVNTQSSE